MKKRIFNYISIAVVTICLIWIYIYYTENKIIRDMMEKEHWATAHSRITDSSWFTKTFIYLKDDMVHVKFMYMLALGDLLWEGEQYEKAKIVYAKAIKEYYDSDRKLNCLIGSSMALDRILVDLNKKPTLNNFSNISVMEEEIEKIEMPNCVKAEEYLECNIMNVTDDGNLIRLTIKAKNTSEDIIMKSSEISIIIFGDKKEYVNGSLLMIPRLEPGEEKYLFSQIDKIGLTKNITLKFYYKVNYVEVEK